MPQIGIALEGYLPLDDRRWRVYFLIKFIFADIQSSIASLYIATSGDS